MRVLDLRPQNRPIPGVERTLRFSAVGTLNVERGTWFRPGSGDRKRESRKVSDRIRRPMVVGDKHRAVALPRFVLRLKLSSTETMIPNRGLPPEILDYIIEVLPHQIQSDTFGPFDVEGVLERCCLVSKSWIPRARRYLFADVSFHTPDDLETWKEMFPDPSNSPGFHTRTLNVYCPQVVTAADAEEGGWIRGFCNIDHLYLSNREAPFRLDPKISYAPFRHISPNLKALHVSSPFLLYARVFDIIYSSPFLEDLDLFGDGDVIDWEPDSESDETQVVNPPSASPVFTGSLQLFLPTGMTGTARRLLNLPNGLHFRKLKLRWFEEENDRTVAELVTACSETLEHLDIAYHVKGIVLPVHIWIEPVTNLDSGLQMNPHPTQSISPGQQNSNISYFGAVHWTAGGSSWRLEPLDQKIEIFNNSQFTSHQASVISPPIGVSKWRRQSRKLVPACNGRTLIAFWSNF